MSYAQLGPDRYIFDVYVPACESPTGSDVRIRVRQRCPADKVRALDAEIAHAAVTTGAWSASTSAILRGTDDAARNADILRLHRDPRSKRTIRNVARHKQTLEAALAIAWEDEGGWKDAKTGALQYRSARAVLNILGAQLPCDSITPADYETVRTKLRAQGYSEAAVTRHLQAFYRVLYFAERKGWIKHRPKFKRSRLNSAHAFTFTPEAEAKCIAFFQSTEGSGPFPKGMHEVFIASIDAGLRLGEVLALTGEGVDVQNRTVRVRDERAKDGDPRQVTITDRLAEILERRMAEHGQWRLFPGWTQKGVIARMAAAREHLDPGNEDFTFPAARHTHLMRLAAEGMDLKALMKQAGHTNPGITMRYIHMASTARRAKMMRLLARN